MKTSEVKRREVKTREEKRREEKRREEKRGDRGGGGVLRSLRETLRGDRNNTRH